MSVSQTCFSSSGVSFGIDWDYLKKPSLERHQPRSVGSLARAVDGSLRNQKFRQKVLPKVWQPQATPRTFGFVRSVLHDLPGGLLQYGQKAGMKSIATSENTQRQNGK